eukprot:320182_1
MNQVALIIITLTTFVLNTLAESYTCSIEDPCSETINCETSPCLLFCASAACSSITVNAQSVAILTINSTETTSMTINAAASQLNIHCIGSQSCASFTVYAGASEVFIEAIGSSAITGGTWHLKDASSISMSCTSGAESACNPSQWNMPQYYSTQSS